MQLKILFPLVFLLCIHHNSFLFAQEEEEEKEAAAVLPVKAFTIKAKKYSFEPSTIVVNKGDRVKITLISEDTSHGFKLGAYGIDIKIRPNTPHLVDFVANKEGTFTFKCSKFCGWGHFFMKGKLIVEEKEKAQEAEK